jgi:hypothetical protein
LAEGTGLGWVVAIGLDDSAQRVMVGVGTTRHGEVRVVSQELRPEMWAIHTLGAHRERRLSKRALAKSVTVAARELNL